MKPHYHGHRLRLKEKFLREPSSLEDYEIIELLLGYVIKGKDVKPTAKLILKELKHIGNVFNIDEKINGVGKETVILFKIIKELFFRIESSNQKNAIFSNAEAVYNFLKFKIGYEEIENMAILLLNSQNSLITYKIINTGTVNESYFPIREIVKFALLNNAVSVIISHNHPSGNISPSQSDILFTKQLIEGLNSVNIKLLDHIIIYKNKYLSFKKEKII